MTVWCPTKLPGMMSVPSPISAESLMGMVCGSKGRKWRIKRMNASNGSGCKSKALPSGHSTSLLIRTTVAAELSALA